MGVPAAPPLAPPRPARARSAPRLEVDGGSLNRGLLVAPHEHRVVERAVDGSQRRPPRLAAGHGDRGSRSRTTWLHGGNASGRFSGWFSGSHHEGRRAGELAVPGTSPTISDRSTRPVGSLLAILARIECAGPYERPPGEDDGQHAGFGDAAVEGVDERRRGHGSGTGAASMGRGSPLAGRP